MNKITYNNNLYDLCLFTLNVVKIVNSVKNTINTVYLKSPIETVVWANFHQKKKSVPNACENNCGFFGAVIPSSILMVLPYCHFC